MGAKEKASETHDRMAQLQVLHEQIQQIKAMLEKYDENLAEMSKLIETLSDLSSLKGDEEVFMPLSNGIFVPGKLSGSKLKVNVGQGVMVEKTIEDTMKLIQEQYKEMESARAQALVQFHEFLNYAQRLESRID